MHNVYLHVTKELKKEASQKFAQLMRSLDYHPLCKQNVSILLTPHIQTYTYQGFRRLITSCLEEYLRKANTNKVLLSSHYLFLNLQLSLNPRNNV